MDNQDRIVEVNVRRGAPCGATWSAAEKIVGLSVAEALTRIGLEVQLFCKAKPSDWDPLHGSSPVHFAGKIHRSALERAVRGSTGAQRSSKVTSK